MKTISSRDNPRYKELKHLAASAAARRKAGSTLLDGVHLCTSYLQHVGLPSLCVISDAALEHAEAAPLAHDCEARGVPCLVLPTALYDALNLVEHGVGLLFVIPIPQVQAPSHLDTGAVLLDGLQDPGNLGSVLRSAAAAGIEQVYCGTGTVAAWAPKVLRAGMGAHFLLKIIENADLADVIRRARVPVVATSSHASQPLYDSDLRAPLAWLFGNEGKGVAPDLLAQATMRVTIPQPGPVESLNVAACAAVCLFEQVRQRMAVSASRR